MLEREGETWDWTRITATRTLPDETGLFLQQFFPEECVTLARAAQDAVETAVEV